MRNNYLKKKLASIFLTVFVPAGWATDVYADSAHEWGAWNNAPIFENDNHHGTLDVTKSLDDEVIRARNNGGVTTATINVTSDVGRTGWVGYELYSTWIDPTLKVATLEVTPNFPGTHVSVGWGTVETGALAIVSNNADYNLNFNSNTLNHASLPSLYLYNGEINANNDYASDQPLFVAEFAKLSAESDGTYLWNIDKFNAGNSHADNSGWTGYVGKLMPVSDVTSLSRLGSIYTLSGSTVQGGAVTMTINFGHALWNGQWSATSYSNAFNANGTISGNAISSTSVAGTVSISSAKFVQGGSVSGDLIGGGSTVGVIGKTSVNVGAVGTVAVQVNDVFIAH